MTEAVVEHTVVRKFVRISRDDDPMSPREWDNLGTMVGWHRRYTIGDEQPVLGHDEWLLDLVDLDRNGLEENWARMKGVSWTDMFSDQYKEACAKCEEWIHQRVQRELKRRFIMLPVYMYDHSGVTFNTAGFHCPWDSGQVGYIYVSKEDVRENWGWKAITSKRRKYVENILRSEVKVYAQWAEGDVYGFEVVEVRKCDLGHEHEEVVDSCWGFYGTDWDENGIKDHLPDELCDHEKWEIPW